MNNALLFLFACSASRSVVNAQTTSNTEGFNLIDQYIYGKFSGYNSVNFNLNSNNVVDFWVTNQQSFDLWLDAQTIPTAKMYQSTYCSNCVGHSTQFTNPTPGTSDNYVWVVSSLFPEVSADGTVGITYTGTGSYESAVTADDTIAICFSGDSTVQRDDGETISIRDVKVGESIMAVGVDGSLGFSPVVAVPHPINKHYSSFFQLHTAGDRAPLEVTRDHLVLTCPQKSTLNPCESCPAVDTRLSPITMLVAAKDVTTSMCLLNVDSSATASTQWVPVVAITKRASRGIYSVVTKSAYPVVSGVVASPFATSHVLGHFLYAYVQPIYESGMSIMGIQAGRYNNALASAVAYLFNTPFLNKAIQQLSGAVHAVLSSSAFGQDL